MVAVMEDWREDLRQVDQLCKLWADFLRDGPSGGLHPIAKLMRQAAGAGEMGMPPPIPDNVMILERILASSDRRYHALCVVWYRHNDSIIAKAKRLNTNRTDLYAMWRRTLEYLRGRLHGEGVDV